MFDYTLDIGTDVAGFFLFHPDDLAHRKNAPDDWYTYDFSCGKEFAAGRLIAWTTGGDGGYRLRLTDGGLTDAERAQDLGAWTFGFAVKHGRVFVDNVDCLPSLEQFSEANTLPDQWFAVPEGNYRVRVHAIARGGTIAEDEENSENASVGDADDALPDYVLCWETTTADLASLVLSPTPPDIEPFRGEKPHPSPGVSADAMPEEVTDALEKDTYLLLEVDTFMVPGFSETFLISDALYEALSQLEGTEIELGDDIAVTTGDVPPGLATLARTNQTSRAGNAPATVGIQGQQLVRIVERLGETAIGLPRVRVEAVKREDAPLSPSELDALKADFAACAQNPQLSERMESPSFEQERVAAMQSGTKLTIRLIHHLVKSAPQRADLLAQSDRERAAQLHALLQTFR